MWWIYALLSAVFASLTAIFAKIGVQDINSNLATALRTLVVLLLLWGIVWRNGNAKEMASISTHNITFLVLSGLATGCSWLFYFKALQVGKVSQVAVVDKLSVALTVLLSMVFLNEPVTLKTGVSAGLIILGTLLLIL